ncbi:GNAT family N-acetyltransferase [Elizabethkingia anophelis]|uniref:GNAT family N-acetyltransferase n=1 Tax=Elizabethkingia anophelis TaxID=1117645 RepID=UPI002011FA22|nr:GNAT family N-acetyltransferase [Elizabethkingia anophelis]MCL1688771.1 GNAT family N-acetyltransferase [Elizabethkingia anophelis]MCT3833469.1 GNAT family N-acetyltransferase [Elizabethkingia anophelis]MCT3976516.1 GNAT family N-acetyltransferase [Elizabethkingia anophelis]MCT4040109.1 GNAT family N-acetyltransferase [Elizabethkingia anophelis]MCT4171667.1 GNAT family N-acetyltransferase [Elizabethkingia anophelis]
MRIEYRNILPNESRAYRMIRLESLKEFPVAFSASYEESVKMEKLRLEEDIETQMSERFVTGVFIDNELSGICAFVNLGNNTGNILQMYVRKGFQGNNIGMELIRAVIQEARYRFHNIEIELEVKPDNINAFNLYKKAGFEEIINDSDIIVMRYTQN